MAVQVSYPGVYIEEFTPGAPIEGVGTSTAAFIGPAARGELDTPTKITSWDQFRTTFGEQPLPGFFLWYAVRGFFENGGQVCYVVRASNGTYGEASLNNGAGDPVIRVRARQPGALTPSLQVEITRINLLPATSTTLYQPTGTFTNITGREVTVTNANMAAQFRPGDWLDVAGERVQLAQVRGNILRVSNAPASPPATGAVRLADAPAGTQTLRIRSTVAVPPGVLVTGTMLTITQGTTSMRGIVETVQTEPLSPTLTTCRVTFREGLGLPLSLDPANPATVQSEEFSLVVIQGTASIPYDNLSMDPAHPRYFLPLVNNSDHLVRLELIEPPPPALPPQNLPVTTGVTLTGGSSEDLSTLGDTDYIDALETLRAIDDVNLIAIPDRVTAPVQQAVIAHCEQMGERFAVLDSRPGVDLFGAGSIETQRQGLDSTRGYAALYYPWLRVPPAGRGAPVLVPPSGHICGIMARSDTTRGVHKAPANEIVHGALGLEQAIGNTEQGLLNLQGINVIRVFQTGGRPVLWGARTTATDRNWQYVNVRRLFLFLEESIEEGIRWAVFEPNNLQLWQKLKRTITEFLTRVWRDGALFGATPKEAFYVRIDEVLNPFSEQALGPLHIEIGIRPAYPAEFIIVRIGIWQGDSDVSET
jgi:phage tail sheath protein FI